MTLITLGLACPHLGRQPGACTGTHRWLAGIALARWLEPPLPTLGLLALPALVALFLWRREPGPRLAAACALALLAGGVRTLGATPHFGPEDLATYNDQGQVTLVGVVVDEPDVRDIYQNLCLPAPVQCGTGARRVFNLPGVGRGGKRGPALGKRADPGARPRYPVRANGERRIGDTYGI